MTAARRLTRGLASLGIALTMPLAAILGVSIVAMADDGAPPTRAAPPSRMRVEIPRKERPKEEPRTETVQDLIREAFGKRADEALRVAHCESRFVADARSYAGARGIFQLMPVHRWRIAEVDGPKGDLYDPKTNIRVARDLFDDEGWRPWVCARKLGIRT